MIVLSDRPSITDAILAAVIALPGLTATGFKSRRQSYEREVFCRERDRMGAGTFGWDVVDGVLHLARYPLTGSTNDQMLALRIAEDLNRPVLQGAAILAAAVAGYGVVEHEDGSATITAAEVSR